MKLTSQPTYLSITKSGFHTYRHSPSAIVELLQQLENILLSRNLIEDFTELNLLVESIPRTLTKIRSIHRLDADLKFQCRLGEQDAFLEHISFFGCHSLFLPRTPTRTCETYSELA